MGRALAVVALLVCPAAAFEWLKPVYWQRQAATAKLVGSAVSRGNRVLEVDAVEGAKNLYYLPFGCSVTQWLGTDEALKEFGPVGVAAQNLGLTVEVAKCRKTTRLPLLEPSYFDRALCIGALERALNRGGDEAAAAMLDLALKAVKPNGRLCFVEEAKEMNEKALAAILDEHPLVADCVATVENGYILGVVTTQLDPNTKRGITSKAVPPTAADERKKKR
ncbi:hypothetical protein M885DRAFT_521186 [Pelagophyceae sp. CCMP2097]|nr:hypothetical protein M885DRAFT_521186 [Pelagophyceae sp. CCMP2097]